MTFFDRVEDDTEQRVADVMKHLTPKQVEALQGLGALKSAYYLDAEQVLHGEVQGQLSDEDVDPNTAKQIALAGGHITLRGITLFSLAMAEIMVFGKVQGPLPLESARFAYDDED